MGAMTVVSRDQEAEMEQEKTGLGPPSPCDGCGQFKPIETSGEWPVQFCAECQREMTGTKAEQDLKDLEGFLEVQE